MAQLLYLRNQGSKEVVAFELDEEFRLDEKTVLTHFGLRSLLIWQEDAGCFVAVRFRPDGLSYKPFKPNTKQHALVVKDEPGGVGQAPSSQAGGVGQAPSSQADIGQLLMKKMSQLSSQLSVIGVLVKKELRPSTSKVSQGRDRRFRDKLIKFYAADNTGGGDGGNTMVCLVTGWEVPKEALVAGHLFPVRLKAYAPNLLGMPNINDPRNGLLWCDFIEYAYERWSICFSFGQAPGTFKLHVVDSTILNTKLQDKAMCNETDYLTLLQGKTYKDIDGIDVKIAGTAQPFQRALAWQAAGAIDLAREHKRLPATLDVDALNLKVASEYDEQEAMQTWLAQCSLAGAPEEQASIEEGEEEEIEGS